MNKKKTQNNQIKNQKYRGKIFNKYKKIFNLTSKVTLCLPVGRDLTIISTVGDSLKRYHL
jgi:hypothetical protein